MSMGTSKQVVRPPQRGIFPLDHMAECTDRMQAYLECLQTNKDVHHLCRDLSRQYLECRMERGLMSKENLDHLGYGEDKKVEGAKEYDKQKERAGFTAGKHISSHEKWWFQRWFG
jgi:cytochrome c oxidase assembly protein subunit 19